jgi:hypothetical protein
VDDDAVSGRESRHLAAAAAERKERASSCARLEVGREEGAGGMVGDADEGEGDAGQVEGDADGASDGPERSDERRARRSGSVALTHGGAEGSGTRPGAPSLVAERTDGTPHGAWDGAVAASRDPDAAELDAWARQAATFETLPDAAVEMCTLVDTGGAR